MMVVLGSGMGFLMQTTMLISQNSVEQKDLGVASSAATFFRSIGGSFGVSLFGAIFNHGLKNDIAKHLPAEAAAGLTSGGGAAGLTQEQLAKLPANVRNALLHGIATATGTVFFWAIFIAVLIPVMAVFIQQVALRGSNATPPADGAAVPAQGGGPAGPGGAAVEATASDVDLVLAQEVEAEAGLLGVDAQGEESRDDAVRTRG